MDFLQIFTKEKADARLFSVLFYGVRGVGKRTTVYDIICNCSPGFENKIKEGKSCDVLEFYGDEGIQYFKEHLQGFDSPAKELPHKWLIVNNIEYASKEVNNLLLKLIEDRKYFHVFVNSTSKEINPALLSRLHIYTIKCLSPEKMKEVLQRDKAKGQLLLYLDRYCFRSVFEVETYFRLAFEETFSAIYVKKQKSGDILKEAETFLNRVKDLKKYEKEPAMLFFLEFVLTRLVQLPEYSTVHYQYFLSKMKQKFASGLFCPENPFVNKENQFKAFILSLFMLKEAIA